MNHDLSNKKNDEKDKLLFYRNICFDALNEFATNHPYQLASYEKDKIFSMLDRIINSEIDFLERSAEDYFELYEDD